MLAEMINPDEIRGLIRDDPEFNVILSYQEQFEDEEIYSAAENAEDEIFARFPALRGKHIPKIIINNLTLFYLMQSVSAQELRNQMQINDNNVGAIDYSNKAPQYMQMANTYKQQAIEMLQGIAANNYYTTFWGGVHSTSSEIEGDDG